MDLISARVVITALDGIPLPTRGKKPKYLITTVPDKTGKESPVKMREHGKRARNVKAKATKDRTTSADHGQT